MQARRSTAGTACLSCCCPATHLPSYLASLCLLPQAVATLSLDWPASFCRMRAGLVAAQADMLRRLDWRLRLDPVKGGLEQL